MRRSTPRSSGGCDVGKFKSPSDYLKAGLPVPDGRPVDLSELKQVGTYPNTEERCVRELARAISALRPEDKCVNEHTGESQWTGVVSWPAQVEANAYYNANGFVQTLTRRCELWAQLGWND